MRIGVRWGSGASPPPSVPKDLHEAIASLDNGADSAQSWTLTWLEGLPVCERSDGVTVRLTHDGRVAVSDSSVLHPADDEEDDDWLR